MKIYSLSTVFMAIINYYIKLFTDFNILTFIIKFRKSLHDLEECIILQTTCCIF